MEATDSGATKPTQFSSAQFVPPLKMDKASIDARTMNPFPLINKVKNNFVDKKSAVFTSDWRQQKMEVQRDALGKTVDWFATLMREVMDRHKRGIPFLLFHTSSGLIIARNR